MALRGNVIAVALAVVVLGLGTVVLVIRQSNTVALTNSPRLSRGS